jgi:hypothetical protein
LELSALSPFKCQKRSVFKIRRICICFGSISMYLVNLCWYFIIEFSILNPYRFSMYFDCLESLKQFEMQSSCLRDVSLVHLIALFQLPFDMIIFVTMIFNMLKFQVHCVISMLVMLFCM